MHPEAFPAPSPETSRGLPPVSPPSGKFIAQLFLVPFLIVALLICFALLVRWWAGTAWSPDEYIERLDNPNEDVRWRAAENLAQVLLRDDHLASNVKFTLDLAERLHRAWSTLADTEKSVPGRGGASADTTVLPKTLEGQRNHVTYLAACLGNTIVPVGAELLGRIAQDRTGQEDKAVSSRRCRAVWALANLGENIKRVERLQDHRRQSVLAELDQETASPGNRGVWARAALTFLTSSPPRPLEPLGIGKTLLDCAEDADPFLRQITSYAMNFWPGDERESTAFEAALVKLSSDNGRGEEILQQWRDEEKLVEMPVTRVPGLRIRYNATVTLARRGSDKVRLTVLQEMLDLGELQKNFQIKRKKGGLEPDKETIALTVNTALQAATELKARLPSFDLSRLYPLLDQLAQAEDVSLQEAARRVSQKLGRK